jgi:hypothetical protein
MGLRMAGPRGSRDRALVVIALAAGFSKGGRIPKRFVAHDCPGRQPRRFPAYITPLAGRRHHLQALRQTARMEFPPEAAAYADPDCLPCRPSVFRRDRGIFLGGYACRPAQREVRSLDSRRAGARIAGSCGQSCCRVLRILFLAGCAHLVLDQGLGRFHFAGRRGLRFLFIHWHMMNFNLNY